MNFVFYEPMVRSFRRRVNCALFVIGCGAEWWVMGRGRRPRRSVVAEAAVGLEAGGAARRRVQEQFDVPVVHVVLIAPHRLQHRIFHLLHIQGPFAYI